MRRGDAKRSTPWVAQQVKNDSNLSDIIGTVPKRSLSTSVSSEFSSRKNIHWDTIQIAETYTHDNNGKEFDNREEALMFARSFFDETRLHPVSTKTREHCKRNCQLFEYKCLIGKNEKGRFRRGACAGRIVDEHNQPIHVKLSISDDCPCRHTDFGRKLIPEFARYHVVRLVNQDPNASPETISLHVLNEMDQIKISCGRYGKILDNIDCRKHRNLQMILQLS